MNKHRSLIISYFDKVTLQGCISFSGTSLALHLHISRETVSRWLKGVNYYEDKKILVFCIDKQDVIKGKGRGNPANVVSKGVRHSNVKADTTTSQIVTSSTVKTKPEEQIVPPVTKSDTPVNPDPDDQRIEIPPASEDRRAKIEKAKAIIGKTVLKEKTAEEVKVNRFGRRVVDDPSLPF